MNSRGVFIDCALDVIGFVDQLSVEQTSRIVSDQLLRSTTSIGANVIEAQAASSRKIIPISSLTH